jgi:hypothetical protein
MNNFRNEWEVWLCIAFSVSFFNANFELGAMSIKSKVEPLDTNFVLQTHCNLTFSAAFVGFVGYAGCDGYV